jgi:hypothetical protein
MNETDKRNFLKEGYNNRLCSHKECNLLRVETKSVVKLYIRKINKQ